MKKTIFLLLALIGSQLLSMGCKNSRSIDRLLGRSDGSAPAAAGQLKPDPVSSPDTRCSATGSGRLVISAGPIAPRGLETEFTVRSTSLNEGDCPEEKVQSDSNGNFVLKHMAAATNNPDQPSFGPSGQVFITVGSQTIHLYYESPANLGEIETCPTCL